MRSGLEALVQARFRQLRGKRVGLICNPTAVDRRLAHAADLLRWAPGVDLACFSARNTVFAAMPST